MKEFLREVLIDPFSENDWVGYVCSILFWLISISIVASFIWFSGWLIDSSFITKKTGTGIVCSKYIEPPSVTTTYTYINNHPIPINTYHPESYNIEINISGLTDVISVPKSYFGSFYINKKVTCTYTNGRFFKTLYIKQILP